MSREKEKPKPKRILLNDKPIEIKEEPITTGERIRYQIIYGASKSQKGTSLSDLSDKEKEDLEKFHKIVEIASLWYQKPLQPTQKGITTLVKKMFTDIVLTLYEKGEVRLRVE